MVPILQRSSPNFDKGRQGKKISKVVMHWIVGDLSAADAVFSKPSSKVSAHYAVGNAQIHQYVKEEDTAWHAGNYDMNLQSIGIEHRGGPELPISEETYQNSADLLADICKRNNIPLDREHIIKHNEVKATQCPGNLDIDRIIKMAKGKDVCAEKVESLEKQIDELRDNRNKYRTLYEESQEKSAKEIADKNKTIDQLQKQLAEMTVQLSNISNEVNVLRDRETSTQGIVDAQKAKIITLSDSQKELLREIEELKKTNSKDLNSYPWSDRFKSLFWR